MCLGNRVRQVKGQTGTHAGKLPLITGGGLGDSLVEGQEFLSPGPNPGAGRSCLAFWGENCCRPSPTGHQWGRGMTSMPSGKMPRGWAHWVVPAVRWGWAGGGPAPGGSHW